MLDNADKISYTCRVNNFNVLNITTSVFPKIMLDVKVKNVDLETDILPQLKHVGF